MWLKVSIRTQDRETLTSFQILFRHLTDRYDALTNLPAVRTNIETENVRGVNVIFDDPIQVRSVLNLRALIF